MTWLLKILESMSAEIVKAFQTMMQQGLQNLYEMALKTDNEWDDMGVKLMAKVFGVELKEPE